MPDIIMTWRREYSWSEHLRVIAPARNYSRIFYCALPFLPKHAEPGAHLYVVYRGHVQGWIEIDKFCHEFIDRNDNHRVGSFVGITGPFHHIHDLIPMRGFQGWRYFNDVGRS